MAAREAPQGQPQPFEGPVATDGFYGILAAGGGEAARGGKEGGDAELIEADGKDEDKAEEALHDSCAAMLVRSFSILR